MAGYSRIAGITIEIGGETTKLQNALKGVNGSVRTTSNHLKDVNKLLKLDPTNTELLSQKQTYLAKAIDDTKAKLEKEKTLLAQLKESNTTGEVTDEQMALEREIIATEQSLKSLQKEYKQFGSVAGQQLQAVGAKMQDVGSKVSNIGQSLSTKVTLPIVAAGTVAVTKFAEVDKTMQLTNATMGNTEDEAKLLDKAMKEAAANSTFGMSDAAGATLNFARAGLDAEQAANALAPAMNLAAGEGGNLDTVSSGLVATINGFGDTFENTTHYADVFAAACNNSALDVDSLSGAMSVAAPIFKAAGYNVEDAALFMGVMANNGIDASTAANALKTGIARLASPTEEAANKLAELEIEIFNSDGSMKSSLEVQKLLHDSFSTLSEQEQIAAASAIFGKNQMSNWLALINTAPADVEELSGSISDCAGTTNEMAEAMMGGFGGSIEKLKSSLDVLMTTLGGLAAQYLTPVITKVQTLVDKFLGLDERTQGLIVKALGIAAAAGPVLMIGGKLISGADLLVSGVGKVISIGGALAGGATSLVPIITSVITTAGPLLLGGAVIAGIVAGGVWVVKHWDEIKEKAGELKEKVAEKWDGLKTKTAETWENIKSSTAEKWNEAKEKVSGAAADLKESAAEKWDSLKSATSTAWENIKSKVSTESENIRAKATEKWENLKSKTSDAWANIKSKISTNAESAKSIAAEKWENLKSKTSTSWENIKSSINEKGGGIRGVISTATQGYLNLWQNAFQSINSATGGKLGEALSTAQGKLESIRQAFSSKMDAAKSAVSSAISGIKGLFNFQWSLPQLKMPHFSWDWQDIGGIVKLPRISVSWYKKAYDNPMLFNSPTVIPTAAGLKGFGDGHGAEIVMGLDKLRDLVGSSGNTTNIINVYAAPGQDINELADALQARLAALERQKKAAYA